MKKDYACNARWGVKALSAAVIAMAFTASASAQEYRKSWDFTKWSSTTVANLKAANAVGGNADNREWSDVEKAGNSTPTDISKDNCFWQWKNNMSENEYVMANGQVITELEGLYYTNSTLGSLAIAVNYGDTGSTGFGPYNGSSYLWFGGSKKDYFVIPHVAPGTEIKMGVESHKLTDARGVELYIGRGHSGTKLKDPEGNTVEIPKTYQDLVWLVPEDTEPTNEDGTVDIQIYNTNGCHLYYITVGDGGDEVEENRKIAVISPLGEDDDLFFAVQDGFDASFLSDASLTLEELQEYEAILISNKVTADSPLKDVLRSAVAYQPVVNLSAALIESWGLGTVANSETNTITVSEKNLENALFANLNYDEGLELVADGVLPVVTPGEYFANDDVLATVGDAAYILVHNPNRNAHILIPFAAEAAVDHENMTGLVANALKVAAKSKKAITKASAPVFSSELKKLMTTVTATGAGVIRYAIGADAEVNENSAVYNGPMDFTEPTMIKAYMTLDGYLPSDVVTYEVDIQDQAYAPTFTMTQSDESTTVEISSESEGAKIYYTFWLNNGTINPAQATLYTEPIVLSTEPTAIYAIATLDKALNSEISEDYVAIKSLNNNTIRMDTVSHFSASSDAWFPTVPHENGTGAAKAHYYWGKSAWSYYSDVKIGTEQVEDGEGNLVDKDIFAPDANAVRTMLANEGNGTENDWRLFSQGQVLTGELTNKSIAEVGNSTTGYYHEAATDLIGGPASTGYITFGGKSSGDPYTGAIESIVKFTAPFDVVVYVGNGNNSSKAAMELQTSTDGQTWTKVADLNLADTQRYIKKNRISINEGGEMYVRVAHTGGGTKAQVYDIYILNHGKLSEDYSGIEEVITDEAAEVIAVEYYNINGMRIAEPENGFYIMRAILSNGKVVVKKLVK